MFLVKGEFLIFGICEKNILMSSQVNFVRDDPQSL